MTINPRTLNILEIPLDTELPLEDKYTEITIESANTIGDPVATISLDGTDYKLYSKDYSATSVLADALQLSADALQLSANELSDAATDIADIKEALSSAVFGNSTNGELDDLSDKFNKLITVLSGYFC